MYFQRNVIVDCRAQRTAIYVFLLTTSQTLFFFFFSKGLWIHISRTLLELALARNVYSSPSPWLLLPDEK